jgi:hypothetical protein
MDLVSHLENLECRVIDPDEARTTTHREVLLILARTFNKAGAILLCEPSVVGARAGPPDIAVIDPQSGVHVIEVKGVPLDQIRSVQAGGAIEIEYSSTRSRKDPSKQARQSLFDIKDASARHFNGDMNVFFQSWVVFPRIRRNAWELKFGDAVATRPDVLYLDDLESSALAERMRRAGVDWLARFGLTECPPQQIQSVLAAFGDSAALAPLSRPHRRIAVGSMGEKLAEDFAEYRALTEPQQKLTSSDWNDGPRLVRGVAGSGKTVVLATQVARTVERLRTRDLFERDAKPILAVCFNRTLVPFLRQRIEMAYLQRTGQQIPPDAVEVKHFHRVIYDLSRSGFCGFVPLGEDIEPGKRALACLQDLEVADGPMAERLSQGLYHAVFVDEGQDFDDNEYRVLIRISAKTDDRSPRMFVFYDDAQNLFGRSRPKWTSLGLEVRGGRSVVLEENFRNTRQIVEPAFNVLIGTYATDARSGVTQGFADTQTLSEKGGISWKGKHVRTHFAKRHGDPVVTRTFDGYREEEKWITARCEDLLSREGLLPQDVLVLTARRSRAVQLMEAIGDRLGNNQVRTSFSEGEKDRLAIQPGKLTVSTIAPAKGYDAPFVMLASLNDIPSNVEGRASFYVACTRAREWMEVQRGCRFSWSSN